jgi:hypothetical protein
MAEIITEARPELKEVVDLLTEWLKFRKVGSVTVNFYKGGVSSVKIAETLKLRKGVKKV